MSTFGTPARRGFTMIELLGVMAIIGILLALILTAAAGAAREAEEQSTRSLIAKLDSGMADLMEQLLTTRNDPTLVHFQWAHVWNANMGKFNPQDRATMQRAEVLANFDKVRAEVPDVFFVQDVSLGAQSYPLNFAQQQFLTGNGPPWDYVLPIGTGSVGNPGTGIYGASYAAAASLYKNLGQVPATVMPNAQALLPQGYDGVDNDQDNLALIDNLNEGIQGNAQVQASVAMSLQMHQHKTARSEMLYALLVEGRGPYGSIFNKDDFTSLQVGDTDNDGLPEFIDAWGEPLYFYRWPIFYHSDLQKGTGNYYSPQPPFTGVPGPYAGVFESREQDPLDPNQQLTSPVWWSSANNAGPAALPNIGFPASSGPLSGAALAFHTYFHQLTEPFAPGGASIATFWDRSTNFYARRAFYSRFLILSGGPDKVPGVPVLPDVNLKSLVSGGGANAAALALQFESQAAPYDLLARLNAPDLIYGGLASSSQIDSVATANNGTTTMFTDESQDDITNHNLQTGGGASQ